MFNTRQLSFAVLACLAAGCASNKPATAPTPAEGPKAMINATYYGGMLNRQAEAVFKVEENSYVMVGHLGGDGRLTVLYPEDARETGRVQAGKWFRTSHVAAYYDAAPQLYSFATATYRSFGAQLDSYDGRGYGFIFIIASKRPLQFDRVSEFGLWNDMSVSNYRVSADPRIYVNSIAALLAGNHAYTLKFARSTSTFAVTSYSDQLFDCAYLSAFGFSSWLTPYAFSSFFQPSVAFPGARGGCGGRSAYAYGYWRPILIAATPTAVPTDDTPASPREGTTLRPKRHNPGNPRSGLSFASPVRGSSPSNPAAAPRHWSWRAFQPSAGPSRGGYDVRRSSPSGASSSGATSSGSGAARSAPMSAPNHRAVVERAAPAPQQTQKQSTSSSSSPKGDQKQQ